MYIHVQRYYRVLQRYHRARCEPQGEAGRYREIQRGTGKPAGSRQATRETTEMYRDVQRCTELLRDTEKC